MTYVKRKVAGTQNRKAKSQLKEEVNTDEKWKEKVRNEGKRRETLNYR